MFLISFYIFSSFLTYTDYKKFLVPNNLLIAMSLMMVIFGFLNQNLYTSSIILSFVILLFFIVLLLLNPTQILGGGDIKYMMIIGLYLGVTLFPIFLIITGILQTLTLLYMKRIKKRRIAPMVPVMFFSVIIVDMVVLLNLFPNYIKASL